MIRALIAGFFIFNGIPHLIKGITGQKHMTPFRRVSSPVLNVVWAFTNIVIGVLIIGFDDNGQLNTLSGMDFWAFVVGGILLALMAAWLFGSKNPRLPWHKD